MLWPNQTLAGMAGMLPYDGSSSHAVIAREDWKSPHEQVVMAVIGIRFIWWPTYIARIRTMYTHGVHIYVGILHLILTLFRGFGWTMYVVGLGG